MPIAEFWDCSFAEYRATMEGAALRYQDEHNGRAWLAWHIEGLSRTGKKFPKLERMMAGGSSEPRRQSVDEQVAIVKRWHAAINRRAA